MKKEKYYKNNKLNLPAIIFAGLVFTTAVTFILYEHIKYVKGNNQGSGLPNSSETIQPVETYHELTEEEGLERLRNISADFVDNFETEDKAKDFSFTFKTNFIENESQILMDGYLIKKESTLENNYYTYVKADDNYEEMYAYNDYLTTYLIRRSKDNAVALWNTDLYDIMNYSTEEEAFEEVGNGSLGYAVYLILSAGPALSDTADAMLKERVKNSFTDEVFAATDEAGSLKYSYSYTADGKKAVGELVWENYRITHLKTVEFDEDYKSNTASYDFVWTENINKKTILF